jgi:hypothetical protein
LFNANLIAKKLGIKEQTDITTNGENISMNNNIIIEIVEPEED